MIPYMGRKRLTLKQDKFIDKVIETGNPTEAVVQAGYNVKDRIVAKSMASENLAKPYLKSELEARMADARALIQQSVSMCVNQLISLVESPDVPYGVRLNAARDLLDRAGVSQPKSLEITGSDGGPIALENVTLRQVAARAREMIQCPPGEENDLP